MYDGLPVRRALNSDGLEDHRTWDSLKSGDIGLAPTAVEARSSVLQMPAVLLPKFRGESSVSNELQ